MAAVTELREREHDASTISAPIKIYMGLQVHCRIDGYLLLDKAQDDSAGPHRIRLSRTLTALAAQASKSTARIRFRKRFTSILRTTKRVKNTVLGKVNTQKSQFYKLPRKSVHEGRCIDRIAAVLSLYSMLVYVECYTTMVIVFCSSALLLLCHKLQHSIPRSVAAHKQD
eukprot:7569-Heterococcus_DN1.PRE.1